tara:strand:- start:263 stop:487 length:225 start_codon:yes stop_codon:yes gene_type:complete
MKISKKKLKQIIQEMLDASHLPDLEETPERLAADLQNRINKGVATVEKGDAPGELYIMTGDVKGVTVKVLRRGR